MTKKIAILLLPFILISCGLGTKKVKNIVELTPKLSLQTNEPIYLEPSENLDSGIYSFNSEMLKGKAYSFTKSKMATEPVFVDDIIYALDIRSNLSAFSRTQNKIIWSYNISRNKKDNYIGGGIVHHDGKLYVTYGSRLLVVLDAKSGHEIIRKELADIIRIKPVMLNNDIVLVQTISNQVFALNTRTLNPVWGHEGIAEMLSASYSVAPIVHHDNVVITYNSGQVFAVNILSGEVKWSFELPENDRVAIPNFEEASILCAPISDNSNLYVASGLGKLIKLNASSGEVIWQVNANDIQSMSLIGNSLFITNNARQIAAFNPDSGQVKFIAELSDGSDPKKLKAVAFLAPFSSQEGSKKNLNIISTSGVLYSFRYDGDGHLNTVPNIIKIIKNIKFYGLASGNDLYFSTDKNIVVWHTAH